MPSASPQPLVAVSRVVSGAPGEYARERIVPSLSERRSPHRPTDRPNPRVNTDAMRMAVSARGRRTLSKRFAPAPAASAAAGRAHCPWYGGWRSRARWFRARVSGLASDDPIDPCTLHGASPLHPAVPLLHSSGFVISLSNVSYT